MYRDNRLLVPEVERKSVLELLHAAHQGERPMIRQAQRTVFWPGLKEDIRRHIEKCVVCACYSRAQQRERSYPQLHRSGRRRMQMIRFKAIRF